MSNRSLKLLSILVVALIVASFGLSYLKSFQKLNVTIDQGIQANIFMKNPGQGTYSSKSQKTVTKSGSIKLKKGSYVLVFNGNQDFAKLSKEITLASSLVSVTVHPDYSTQKIAAILQTEQPVINNVISSAYPAAITNYTIGPGTLYERGQWYGGKLFYHGKDVFNSDTYKIILKNNNGTWVVATSPPAISLSADDFVNIPKSIISNVNNNL